MRVVSHVWMPISQSVFLRRGSFFGLVGQQTKSNTMFYVCVCVLYSSLPFCLLHALDAAQNKFQAEHKTATYCTRSETGNGVPAFV